MYVCALQAAAIGKRKEKKRQRQREEAAQRLQAHTRRLIRKRQGHLARTLQIAAAVVIQKRIRQTLAFWRVQRRRRARERDLAGSFFRVACRINKTFALASVRVVTTAGCDSSGIDAIDELQVSVCHPVSADVAHASVTRDAIAHIIAANSAPISRGKLVDLVVRRHLDVFRSARHSLLVLAFQSSDDVPLSRPMRMGSR